MSYPSDEVGNHLFDEDLLDEKGEMCIRDSRYAMEQARKKGMTVAFNPSPIDGSLTQDVLALADVLFVNETEGEMCIRDKYHHASTQGHQKQSFKT